MADDEVPKPTWEVALTIRRDGLASDIETNYAAESVDGELDTPSHRRPLDVCPALPYITSDPTASPAAVDAVSASVTRRAAPRCLARA